MYCPQCGYKAKDMDKFCEKCGERLPGKEKEPTVAGILIIGTENPPKTFIEIRDEECIIGSSMKKANEVIEGNPAISREHIKIFKEKNSDYL